MCGRIGLKDPPRDVGKRLDARVSDELEATSEKRYNVGLPTQILAHRSIVTATGSSTSTGGG